MKITYTYDNVKLVINENKRSILLEVSGYKHVNEAYNNDRYFKKQRDLYLERLKWIKNINKTKINISL